MQTTSQMVAHTLVAETAKEFAADFYEKSAHDNLFYKHYPSMKFFIRREQARFIPVAREYLAKLLGTKNVTQSMKDDIFDALMLDRTLPRGVQMGQIKAQKLIPKTN